MADTTKIEWCDHTFNPWLGCTKIAQGCTHCYAEALVKRFGKAAWGPQGTRVKTSEANWRKPLKNWEPSAVKAGERRRVFCASLADVFEDWGGTIVDSQGKIIHRWPNGDRLSLTPEESKSPPFIPGNRSRGLIARPEIMDDLRRDLFAMIDATPHLDWLLLTKRPENIQRMWPSVTGTEHYDPFPESFRPNVWLGTSIAMQDDADRNIPELLKCRDLAPVLFVSYEPAIGPVDFTQWFSCDGKLVPCFRHRPDWIIVGGESGHGARPCDVAWIRSVVQQCQGAGVPCFVKQLGQTPVAHHGNPSFGGGYDCLMLIDRKGGDRLEWPKDLRVREFPVVETVR